MSGVPARPAGRSLWVLLAGILLFHAGWYMLVPFFAVLFTSRKGLTPAEVGTVLAVQSLSLLLGSLAGGALADRYGRKLTLLGGLVLRAGGIFLLGIAPTFMGMIGAAAVAGLGGGLYGPAAKAGIAVLATPENRATVFSWRGIAASVGTTLGPLAGTLLVRGSVAGLFGAAAAVHLALGLATWALLAGEGTVNRQVESPWRDMLRDLPYILFTAATVLSWALFSQLALAVPLFASRALGLEASIGLLWTASSLTVIIFQVVVTRYVAARLHPMTAMALGAVLLGGGLGLVGFARSFTGLLLAVLVFVVGEMFLLPTADSTVTQMARAGAVGSYFGMASFAWGLGEGIGNLTGGGLMQFALGTGRLGVPWAVYAAAGLVIAGYYLALRYWGSLRVRLRPGAAGTKVSLFRPGFPAPDEAGITLGRRIDDE